MSPGHVDDARLTTAQVAVRLGVSARHLARLVRRDRDPFPTPHFLGKSKRWWLSEIVAWETACTSATPPASLSRGAQNLRRGRTPRPAQAGQVLP